jgi:manganese efflux pump family protein
MPPMSFASIFVLAVGLAMDATAVAAARGLSARRLFARDVMLVGCLFGAFQGFMPWLGWTLGQRLGPSMHAWDHWIAFAVLGLLGTKLLWDARTAPAAAAISGEAPAAGRELGTLLLLAFGTSVDALAAGVTLPMLNAPLWLSVLTIGATTAVASAAGMLAGRRFGAWLGKRLDALGGLVLIGLGAKILLEHLTA